MASNSDDEQLPPLAELAKRQRGGWVSTLHDDGTWKTEDFGELNADLLPTPILSVFVNMACDLLEREKLTEGVTAGLPPTSAGRVTMTGKAKTQGKKPIVSS